MPLPGGSRMAPFPALAAGEIGGHCEFGSGSSYQCNEVHNATIQATREHLFGWLVSGKAPTVEVGALPIRWQHAIWCRPNHQSKSSHEPTRIDRIESADPNDSFCIRVRVCVESD